MNRRAFLRNLGLALGAAATVKIPTQWLPQPVPNVDWTVWNAIEVRSGLKGVRAMVNGQDVTHYPHLMKVINRCIRVDTKDGTVRFSAFDADMGSGFRVPIEDMDDTRDIIAGCRMKLNPDAPSTQVLDTLTLDGSNAHVFKDYPQQIGEVTVEALIPRSMEA